MSTYNPAGCDVRLFLCMLMFVGWKYLALSFVYSLGKRFLPISLLSDIITQHCVCVCLPAKFYVWYDTIVTFFLKHTRAHTHTISRQRLICCTLLTFPSPRRLHDERVTVTTFLLSESQRAFYLSQACGSSNIHLITFAAQVHLSFSNYFGCVVKARTCVGIGLVIGQGGVRQRRKVAVRSGPQRFETTTITKVRRTPYKSVIVVLVIILMTVDEDRLLSVSLTKSRSLSTLLFLISLRITIHAMSA